MKLALCHADQRSRMVHPHKRADTRSQICGKMLVLPILFVVIFATLLHTKLVLVASASLLVSTLMKKASQ